MSTIFIRKPFFKKIKIFAKQKSLRSNAFFPAFESLTVFKYGLYFEKYEKYAYIILNFPLDIMCHSKISRVNQKL